MTNEERQLLIKDLSARLTYGVYCQIRYKRKNKVIEECKLLDGVFFNNIECLFRSESGAEYSVEYKPYLRPMSSMTEEEREEYFDFRNQELQRVAFAEVGRESAIAEISDWLNGHHFDFRGLIEKGLALEATNGMYKTE